MSKKYDRSRTAAEVHAAAERSHGNRLASSRNPIRDVEILDPAYRERLVKAADGSPVLLGKRR